MLDNGCLIDECDGLSCDSCGYELKGLTEKRCPECGSPFDPVALRDSMLSAIPAWDDKQVNAFIRIIHVLWMIYMTPIQFGRRFPRCYSVNSAFIFRSISLGIAIAVFCLCPLDLPESKAFVGLGAFVSVLCCETMLLVLFAIVLGYEKSGAITVSPWISTSWSGLIGFFRGYLILTAATAGLSLKHHLFWEVAIGCFVWWWFALGSAVAVRRVPVLRRATVIAFIPVVALIAISIGIITSIILGITFWPLGNN